MDAATRKLAEALEAMGKQIISGKGGFWIRGEGFLTIARARRLTGVKATPRLRKPRQIAWGDYATIAAINGVRD